MYDYVDGKVDWMAYGLPVEGEDGPFAGEAVKDVPTCGPHDPAAEARRRLEGSGARAVVVVHEGQVVGAVDSHLLDDAGPDDDVLEFMHPVPGTIRPSVQLSELRHSDAKSVLVTTPDGHLLGQVRPDDVELDDHGAAQLEEELMQVIGAVQEHFGEHEPSEEELRAFLRDRLLSEGRTAEEADRILADMEAGGTQP